MNSFAVIKITCHICTNTMLFTEPEHGIKDHTVLHTAGQGKNPVKPGCPVHLTVTQTRQQTGQRNRNSINSGKEISNRKTPHFVLLV